MSRLLNFNYKEGTKVYFELHNGQQFEGTFTESDTFRIRISNICQLPNKTSIPGSTHFFKKEILVIHQAENEDSSVIEEDIETDSVSSSSDKFKYWTEISKVWSYISVLNEDFNACINKLRLCDTIAINAIPNSGRKQRIYLLAIATKFDLYIINVKLCGHKVFDNGLEEILESKQICKVVFNALLNDCLYHRHNVRLYNVFNLQIADSFVSKKNNCLRKLSDLLVDYVQINKIDAVVVDSFDESILTNPNINKSVLKNSIKSVAYLLPLKFLFESIMLKNFHVKNNYCVNRTRYERPESSLVTCNQVFEEFEKMEITKNVCNNTI